MKKKVAIIHTSLVSTKKLKELFADILPEVKVYNIIDDSLLAEVMENGAITPGIIKRMRNYLISAESLGVDVILSQCSSMGDAIDKLKNTIAVPILKIDQAMAEEAVSFGKRIAVVATVASTIKPSCNLVKQAALTVGKDVEILEVLVDGALDILLKEGDQKKHNDMVLEKINSLIGNCDVIILAQGSMVVLLPYLKDVGIPILSSPELGVRRLRDILNT